MKTCLKSLLAAVLSITALFAAAPARSSPIEFNTFFVNLDFGPGTTQFAFLSNSFASPTLFIDDYLFSVPPPEARVGFGAFADFDFDTLSDTVSFISVALYPFLGDPSVPAAFSGAPAIDALTSLSDATLKTATLATLPSGIYVLEVFGAALADGGGYTGKLTAAVPDLPIPVPEPQTWALLALGLAALAATRRFQAAPAARIQA